MATGFLIKSEKGLPMTYREQMASKGYAELPIPCLQWELMQKASDAFIATLDIPQEILEQIQFRQHGIENETPLGYTRKELGRHSNGKQCSDPKWYFHFHPDIIPLFTKISCEYGGSQLETFLDYARVVYDQAQKVCARALDLLERSGVSSICENYLGTGDTVPNLVIRFLAYDVVKSADCFSACLHRDKSGGTIPLYESGPGLCIGAERDSVTPVGWGRTRTVFMAGVVMEKQLDITAGWHHVVQQTTRHVSEHIARTAIVAFIDPLVPEAVSEREAH